MMCNEIPSSLYDDKNDDLNEASYGDASFSRTDKGGKSSWTEYCACDLPTLDSRCALCSIFLDSRYIQRRSVTYDLPKLEMCIVHIVHFLDIIVTCIYILYGMVRYGMVWYGIVRYGMVWFESSVDPMECTKGCVMMPPGSIPPMETGEAKGSFHTCCPTFGRFLGLNATLQCSATVDCNKNAAWQGAL